MSSVFFLDFKILQGGKLAVEGRSLAATIPLIEIMAAKRAQTTAAIGAKRTERDIDHNLLLDGCSQIDLLACKRDQPQFFGAQFDLILAVILNPGRTGAESHRKIGGQRLCCLFEATTACLLDRRLKPTFNLNEIPCEIGANPPPDRLAKTTVPGLLNFGQRRKEIRIFLKIEEDLALLQLLKIYKQKTPLKTCKRLVYESPLFCQGKNPAPAGPEATSSISPSCHNLQGINSSKIIENLAKISSIK